MDKNTNESKKVVTNNNDQINNHDVICFRLLDYILIAVFVLCIAIEIGILVYIQFALHGLSNYELEQQSVRKLDITDLYAVKYDDYLKKFGKRYDNIELLKRFRIFKHSLKRISQLNAQSGARYGLTQFSDVPKEDLFGVSFGNEGYKDCLKRNRTCGPWAIPSIDFHDRPIPDRFDWRDHGAVGGVLSQKKCNGCWAFGVVGAMESRAAIVNGYFGPNLSVQELIDCATGTSGCSFGHVGTALHFLCADKWGIVPEEYYPLKLFKQDCQVNPREQPPPGLRLQNYWYLCSTSEDSIQRLVSYHGPVVVVVNAAPWVHYIDGVIQRECTHDSLLKHVVQIVGFDRAPEDGLTPPHYIVRNSWGTDFGDAGYVKLAIGDNVCGVADEVSLVDIYY